MSKLKVGVIGCGSIATYRHLPEFATNNDVEIVAVCDIVEERANECANKYNTDAYTDYKEVLAINEIDAISVCLPNYLHAEVSIAALRAGKHVLCEKPMATSQEEAEQMIATAKRSGKKLMIAHNQRFFASHQKAKEIISSGKLGKIYSFRTAFCHGGPEGWSVDGRDSWFFDKEKAFIGALGDLGVHKTDFIRFLLGEEVTEVAGFVKTVAKHGTDVDDNAVCILKTESGIIGTLAASWSYNVEQDNSTVIYAEHAIMRLEEDPTYSLIIQYTNGDIVKYVLENIPTNEEVEQKNSHVIDKFVDAIINDKEVPIPGEEGMRSLQVVLAALESSKKKSVVKLEQS